VILPVVDGATVKGGSCQNVVRIWRVASAIDHGTPLGDGGLLAQVHELTVQLIQVFSHHDAIGVVPGAEANAVARVDGGLITFGVNAQIGSPGFALGTGNFRQSLAVGIGTSQSTQIGAVAGTGAGDKETHGIFLGIDDGKCASRGDGGDRQEQRRLFHWFYLLLLILTD
jgi:hypothetical protein